MNKNQILGIVAIIFAISGLVTTVLNYSQELGYDNLGDYLMMIGLILYMIDQWLKSKNQKG